MEEAHGWAGFCSGLCKISTKKDASTMECVGWLINNYESETSCGMPELRNLPGLARTR